VKDAQATSLAERGEAAFIRMLERPKLAAGLVVTAVLLSSSALFIGLYLDDHVARYIYRDDLDDAPKLFRLLNGGFGLATGVPEENHWQIEEGYAPWWMYPPLRLSLFRPMSLWTHVLDARLWYDNAFFMHLHSLAWLALLVLAMTRLYRGALGMRVGGMAALLFALDHTHGFVAGYICNRHGLITALLGALCLHVHLRGRREPDQNAAGHAALAALLYVLALLSGEAAIAIAGYVFAYELLAHEGPWASRLAAFAPYLAITLIWRVLYSAAGYGGSGSGLYLDPGREPLAYLSVLLERGPLLLFSFFFGPPAELYTVAPAWLSRSMLIATGVLLPALAAAFVPLLRKERSARFWAAGMLFSLVPAATTFPHSRQLLFASFGGLALIAQIWHLYAVELKHLALSLPMRAAGLIAAIALFVHLIVAPLVKPLTTVSVAFSAPLHRGALHVGDELAGKTAVFMTAPDYFAVKIVQLTRRADGAPLPTRWRTLSFGPQAVQVLRESERSLVLDYDGGILATPFMELYRDRRLTMKRGERIELRGMSVEVLDLTPDGRASRARFTFDASLDAPSFQLYQWREGRFLPYRAPRVGERETLPPATLRWSLG
jgi:hypothetical protein